MTITVFGASGRVGRLVTSELLQRGHNVVAFVHSHKLQPTERLRQVSGDVSDRAAVAAAIKGSDAVISTLGSWGTSDKNVVSTAFEKIIPAMEAAGISRVVSVTGSTAGAPGDNFGFGWQVSRALFNMVAPKIERDAEDYIAMLAASQLDWTVLRSPVMLKGGMAYKLDKRRAGLTIPRAAVAAALVDLVESSDWLRAAPMIRPA